MSEDNLPHLIRVAPHYLSPSTTYGKPRPLPKRTPRRVTSTRITVSRTCGTDTLRIHGGILKAAGLSAGCRLVAALNSDGSITLTPQQ